MLTIEIGRDVQSVDVTASTARQGTDLWLAAIL
jgi:hypothetical protein